MAARGETSCDGEVPAPSFLFVSFAPAVSVSKRGHQGASGKSMKPEEEAEATAEAKGRSRRRGRSRGRHADMQTRRQAGSRTDKLAGRQQALHFSALEL